LFPEEPLQAAHFAGTTGAGASATAAGTHAASAGGTCLTSGAGDDGT